MREIKYRAWDKVLNKIFEVKAIYFDGEMIGIKTGDESDGEWTVVKKEHIELMQFTGLKDVNGREIYEGDIFESYKRFVVKFDEFYGGYVPFTHDGGCGCCSDGESGQHPENGMVIGSICENPELLEVEQ